MATHDYEISNQTPANLRADLNNALQAIVTQNSGSSAPTTTFANMLWYDTANKQIKKRNEADTDPWITLGTINEGTGKFDPNNSYVNISYTPVQQGGGSGQGTNKVYIGWGGSQLYLQIDSTNFGGDWPIYTNTALGAGQSWQGVSRATGTWYQNTTARPIQVYIWTTGGNGTMRIGPSTGSYAEMIFGDLSSSTYDAGFFIVPPSYYYLYTGSGAGIAAAYELR